VVGCQPDLKRECIRDFLKEQATEAECLQAIAQERVSPEISSRESVSRETASRQLPPEISSRERVPPGN